MVIYLLAVRVTITLQPSGRPRKGEASRLRLRPTCLAQPESPRPSSKVTREDDLCVLKRRMEAPLFARSSAATVKRWFRRMTGCVASAERWSFLATDRSVTVGSTSALRAPAAVAATGTGEPIRYLSCSAGKIPRAFDSSISSLIGLSAPLHARSRTAWRSENRIDRACLLRLA